jgi:hypothetical protein
VVKVTTAIAVLLTCAAFVAGRLFQWVRDARSAMGVRRKGAQQ